MLCHCDHSSISFRGRVGEVAYTFTIAASGSGVKTLQALYTISSSFGPLARYLIIFASPGQWRWD